MQQRAVVLYFPKKIIPNSRLSRPANFFPIQFLRSSPLRCRFSNERSLDWSMSLLNEVRSKLFRWGCFCVKSRLTSRHTARTTCCCSSVGQPTNRDVWQVLARICCSRIECAASDNRTIRFLSRRIRSHLSCIHYDVARATHARTTCLRWFSQLPNGAFERRVISSACDPLFVWLLMPRWFTVTWHNFNCLILSRSCWFFPFNFVIRLLLVGLLRAVMSV